MLTVQRELTAEQLQALYALSDELADKGDRDTAESVFLDAVAQAERAAWALVADAAAAAQRLELAAYLAQDERLSDMIREASRLDGIWRLIALRRVLAASWSDADLLPIGAVERAVEALARPVAVSH